MNQFVYRAYDVSGQVRAGAIDATDETAANDVLIDQGLAPFSLRPATQGPKTSTIPRRALPAFLNDLSALLEAGVPLRRALDVIAGSDREPALAKLAGALDRSAKRGEQLQTAFTDLLGRDAAFVGNLIAAGQASGMLASALGRGAEMLEEDERSKQEIIEALAYPGFVLIGFFVALWVILTVVAPSMAPLLADVPPGQAQTLRVIVALGAALQAAAPSLGVGAAVAALMIAALAWRGALSAPLSRFNLDGPFSGVARGLVYGAYANSLGPLLSGGVPGPDAMRLAAASVRNTTARKRLEAAAIAVRDGGAVGDCLAQTPGMAPAIVRLARIGEEAGALGPMLTRAGRYARTAALARVRRFAGLLGPALIMTLGLLIGVLIAGLMNGVAALGDAALQ